MDCCDGMGEMMRREDKEEEEVVVCAKQLHQPLVAITAGCIYTYNGIFF